MKRLDRETIQRILDTADIVEVVSDFVTLRRRGNGYIGLCPFHNERTPSFSVSKSKNICKCFSCGKGGSPVNFIMEIEQMNYYEALKFLAKKYNIEIKEHEMSSEEKERESIRESLFAVNDFALKHFEDNLFDTPDGRNIGLSYFLERGLSEASIKKFRLGYAMEGRNVLLDAATKAGYQEKFLIESGLCIKTDQGKIYDRFKGRVIFPVFSISGKTVAFGGRTLKKDIAKYVNSPESVIYHKSNQLYGLYQAKPAIVKADKCILVEGYMDVISMSQSGIENVVASSGTSLTDGQIRLIHRFTDNVTIIYDGDAAGIKASLRGIDMLLSEGLNIKILLLPDGEDPDSFAQSHSASELEEYIKKNEVDFIHFKTATLLQGVENDPIAKSKAISDIVQSISVIPDPLTRNVYIKECSHRLEIDERIVSLEVEKRVKNQAEKNQLKKIKDETSASIDAIEVDAPISATATETVEKSAILSDNIADDYIRFLRPYEMKILQYILRYGLLYLADFPDENEQLVPFNVLQYIEYEMNDKELQFTNQDVVHILKEAKELIKERWDNDLKNAETRFQSERQTFVASGEERIRREVTDVMNIEKEEKFLIEKADKAYQESIRLFTASYIEKNLTSHPDSTIRDITLRLVSEKHTLSKVHTKYSKVETEDERLNDLVPRAFYEYLDAIYECRIKNVQKRMKTMSTAVDYDIDEIKSLMKELVELSNVRSELSKFLGERILNPRK